MDAELRKQLESLFPAVAIEVGELYGPAVARMLLKEVVALYELVREKKAVEAQAAIREKMTVAELAAEKVALADLTRLMAEEQAESLACGRAILLAGLKAALFLALG